MDDIEGCCLPRACARRWPPGLQTLVREYHTAHPLSEGLAREEARERLFAHAAPVLFDRVLADLAGAGRVTGRDRLAGAGHAVSLSPREAEARDDDRAGTARAAVSSRQSRPRSRRHMAFRATSATACSRSWCGRRSRSRSAGCTSTRRRSISSRRRCGRSRRRARRARGRGVLQGALRHLPEVRDSAARVPGPGTCDPPRRGGANRAVTRRGRCVRATASRSFMPSRVASLKLRMPRPTPRASSGRRLAPKISTRIVTMTTSSGIPRTHRPTPLAAVAGRRDGPIEPRHSTTGSARRAGMRSRRGARADARRCTRRRRPAAPVRDERAGGRSVRVGNRCARRAAPRTEPGSVHGP